MAPYTLVFDLDNTLYPASSGLMQAVGARMRLFMRQVTGFTDAENDRLRARFLHDYGTTLAGLEANYQVDSEAFLAFVHDVDHKQFIAYHAQLDQMLNRLPQPKLIFTNGTVEHAVETLDVLGVRHHFAEILDLRAFGMRPKPQAAAYERLAQSLPAGGRALYVDDRPGNLIPAAERGLTTVLVNEPGLPLAHVADFEIRSILELEEIIAALA